jgi:hypothetical protein
MFLIIYGGITALKTRKKKLFGGITTSFIVFIL